MTAHELVATVPDEGMEAALSALIERRQRALLRKIATRHRKIAAMHAELDALRGELVGVRADVVTMWAEGQAELEPAEELERAS